MIVTRQRIILPEPCSGAQVRHRRRKGLQTEPVMRTAVARGMCVWSEKGWRRLPIWSKTQMRTIAEFMKTTLIGGFLIVLPV